MDNDSTTLRCDDAPTDAELFDESRRDPACFSDIYDRHVRTVFRYASSRVGAAGAADVSAETFALAFEHRGRFDPAAASALPWLLAITTNCIRQRRRCERRWLRQPDPPELVDHTSVCDTAISNADAPVLRSELVAGLRTLSYGEREVLLLFAVAELSYDEISITLGIRPGTVRSRLNRARARMRRALSADSGDARQIPIKAPNFEMTPSCGGHP